MTHFGSHKLSYFSSPRPLLAIIIPCSKDLWVGEDYGRSSRITHIKRVHIERINESYTPRIVKTMCIYT